MKILAIETSCDETSAAVTEGRKIISNTVFSQIDIHKKYGGVYPMLAKREHKKKIAPVIDKALQNARTEEKNINAVAVTFGPGLVIALEVGLNKAKDFAKKLDVPLIPVDHTEGHIFSAFAQNRNSNPEREIKFPFLSLVVSGGQTSIVLVKDYADYEILGSTLDDAAGEALDKAAKMLGMSYPGGPIIETMAKKGDPEFLDLPLPMKNSSDLNFSYSGLKTALKIELGKMEEDKVIDNLENICASFQKAVFDHILYKLENALAENKVKQLAVGGGVMANNRLRSRVRKLCKEKGIQYYQPFRKKLYGDNAGMIGIPAYFKYKKGIYLKENFAKIERVGRPNLKMWVANE